MKVSLLCGKSVAAAIAAFSIFIGAECAAETYTLTAELNDQGRTQDFTGFSSENFTSDPEIPSGGITSQDDVIVRGFYDYNVEYIDVNSFTYVARGQSLGGYGAGMSFKYNAKKDFTIKAKSISFLNNNTDINDPTYDTTAEFLNIFVNTIIFRGNMDYDGSIMIGATYSSTTAGLTLAGYDESTDGVYNINKISFNYSVGGNKRDTTLTFNMEDGAIANVGTLSFSTSIATDMTNSTTLNLNGGVLTVGTVNFTNLTGDSITINHNAGVLGASGNLVFGQGLNAGTLKYVMGENAVFNTNGNSITIASPTSLSAAGEKAGLTVRGGGSLILECDASALNGAISVEGASRLNFGSGWASNAESIRVSAGGAVETSGSIVLNSSSSITLEIMSESDYAKLIGASVSDSDSYGSLIFDISSEAFDGKSSISFELSDLIDAGDVDWSKFDISANYDYVLGDNSITFAIPEPSSVAAAFGALALALAACRRRK